MLQADNSLGLSSVAPLIITASGDLSLGKSRTNFLVKHCTFAVRRKSPSFWQSIPNSWGSSSKMGPWLLKRACFVPGLYVKAETGVHLQVDATACSKQLPSDVSCGDFSVFCKICKLQIKQQTSSLVGTASSSCSSWLTIGKAADVLCLFPRLSPAQSFHTQRHPCEKNMFLSHVNSSTLCLPCKNVWEGC